MSFLLNMSQTSLTLYPFFPHKLSKTKIHFVTQIDFKIGNPSAYFKSKIKVFFNVFLRSLDIPLVFLGRG